MRKLRFWTFSLAAVIAGCGPTAAERSAMVLSAYTAQVQNALAEYADRRSTIMRARLRDVAELEERAMDTERRIEAQRLAWTIDHNTEQLRLFDAYRDGANTLATLRKEQRVQLAGRLKIAEEARSAAMVRSRELGSTTETLAALGHDMSPTDQVRFLAAFFKEVRAAQDETGAASSSSAPPAQPPTEQ
jgi:hypothetical protein